MKKILLLTLLSFGLATEIITREFTIEMDVIGGSGGGTSDISEISGLDYGKVTIMPFIEDFSNLLITQVSIYLESGNDYIDCSFNEDESDW